MERCFSDVEEIIKTEFIYKFNIDYLLKKSPPIKFKIITMTKLFYYVIIIVYSCYIEKIIDIILLKKL